MNVKSPILVPVRLWKQIHSILSVCGNISNFYSFNSTMIIEYQRSVI